MKSATVFVLDVRKCMSTMPLLAASKPHEGSGMLDKSNRALAQRLVALKLRELIAAGRKTDVVVLILVGTVETDNPLAAVDQYRNISIYNYNPNLLLSTPTLDMLRFLSCDIESSCTQGDVMDGIILGLHLLETFCRHLKYDRQMLVCANASNPLETDGFEQVLMTANAMRLNFQLVGFDFPSPTDLSNPTLLSNANFLRSFTGQILGLDSKRSSKTVFSPQAALASFIWFKSKQSTSALLYRGSLLFGTEADLSIPVVAYLKTTELKVPSSKKYSMLADGADAAQRAYSGVDLGVVQVTRSYKYVEGGDIEPTIPFGDSVNGASVGSDTTGSDSVTHIKQSEIPPEHVIKAYRYGKILVPFNIQDEEATQLPTEKSMKIAGFVKSSAIPRHYFMSGTMAILPDSTVPGAALLFSALIRGMIEVDSVAIVRYCRVTNAKPKFGVMVPSNKGYGLFIQIPFSGDIRFVTFPPLDYLVAPTMPLDLKESSHGDISCNTTMSAELLDFNVNHPPDGPKASMSNRATDSKSDASSSNKISNSFEYESRKSKFNARVVSSKKAFQAIDALIDAMDISKDSPIVHFNPKNTFNPCYQRINDCIAYRAVHPELRDLPPLHPLTMSPMEPHPVILESAKDAVAQLHDAFKISKVNVKKRKSTKNIWTERAIVAAESTISRDSDRASDDMDRTTRSVAKESSDVLIQPETARQITMRVVDTITTIDPVSDFRSMIARSDGDFIETAMGQLSGIIRLLVEESMGSTFYSKALNALSVLRAECIKCAKSPLYNALMNDLKVALISGSLARTHGEFWERVVQQGESLISDIEEPESLVSSEESAKFLQYKGIPFTSLENAIQGNDADDLFSQMD
ncbi:hypothetical protein BASA50_001465 [Batrachochytrium salamandrivorans]|uniref:ATP-dependent DNA helicase II subunit 2 n=1 Tax=Batrachochytrium salamandrivorans TaxID=1357716 RepID=A0ABQ8FQ94_9FUNG|nr:hypothetical protein BASA60_001424 [Batrachochytrium salamandrivorans]KAH6601607.1 hypothetical protein BASA50_001465 [Batrachochytrium salamandrivorans]